MKDLGLLLYFLGLQITYLPDGLFISQTKYAQDIIDKARMLDCNPSITLCVPYSKLLKDEGTLLADVKTYRSLVGCLQYLTFTGLGIAVSIQYASSCKPQMNFIFLLLNAFCATSKGHLIMVSLSNQLLWNSWLILTQIEQVIPMIEEALDDSLYS